MNVLITGLLIHAATLSAQKYAVWDNQSLTLDNGVVKRVIDFGKDQEKIVSNSYKLNSDPQEFLIPGSEEFSFSLNDITLTGQSRWRLVSVKQEDGEYSGYGVKVTAVNDQHQIRIAITYLLYPGLSIIRKNIEFTNDSKSEIKIESPDIECLRFERSGTGTECWVMNDYARQKSLGQFIGNCYDPVVVIHETRMRRGLVLGNESPGVMKRTTAFLKDNLLTSGLTHIDQNFGFRKWIKPGESWVSPWVFTGLYSQTDDPFEVINGPVNDYTRKHLGTRLAKMTEKPVFVYNTWEPFTHNINEKLIYELADAAADCGIEEFIIDDGWQTSYGDWYINKEKFPNGLKPVFDYIKSKGMKPGLWISIATAESKSNVYKEHPEWLVRKADGSPISLHADVDQMYQWESYSMCMTTGWRDYIKGIILKLVKDYGLEYLKADLAAVTGAYTTDKTRSGCHAKDHQAHKDRNESMLQMYEATWQLFDELHKEAPNLFIDCTFETMGALQLIDLDMCKHADGNWLSNFGENAPFGSMRVRQMSWWRSPVIPATAMVIGNQHLDDPGIELSLMSLAGSLPIVLGDPRLLNNEQRKRMRMWGEWLREMQTRHDFMSFRQDLSGFGEPAEGCWDGFQRINSDSESGGIVGIFRNGSVETERTVSVSYLEPKKTYIVKRVPEGSEVCRMTGKDLQNQGFKVILQKLYDGALFEIIKVL